MDNQYTFTDLQPNVFPSNLDITHAITFGTAYSLKNLKISASFNWHSGKPSTSPVIGDEILNNEINYTTSNSSRLQNYMRIDLSALSICLWILCSPLTYLYNRGSHEVPERFFRLRLNPIRHQ